MFHVFDRICRRHNITYWCTGGTLIGAVSSNQASTPHKLVLNSLRRLQICSKPMSCLAWLSRNSRLKNLPPFFFRFAPLGLSSSWWRHWRWDDGKRFPKICKRVGHRAAFKLVAAVRRNWQALHEYFILQARSLSLMDCPPGPHPPPSMTKLALHD